MLYTLHVYTYLYAYVSDFCQNQSSFLQSASSPPKFRIANIEISIQYSIVLYNVDHFVEIATN